MKKLKLKSLTSVGAILSLCLLPVGAHAALHDLHHLWKHACRDLVTVKHSDLKGKAFKEEVKKCNADPEAYNAPYNK